jgi:hypothetical protein
MKRSKVTYGQLDKVLRSLGFSCRPSEKDPPGRIYEHKKTGAVILLPAFVESDRVFEYHLVAVRGELDNFGIANPTAFTAKLQKAEM